MIDTIIDVSHHNGSTLDFHAAAGAGVVAVIHKATQGTGAPDPMWSVNRPKILAENLLFGSYHFGDGSDGASQAQHFLNVVGPNPGELLCLDFEQNTAGSSMTIEEARAFVTTVNHAIGKWPVLYSGHYLKDLLVRTPDPVLSNCPLWLAQYGPTAVLPVGWKTWTLWQFSDGGVPTPAPPAVPGVGHCDRDRFNGDAAALATFWASVSA